MLDLAQVAGVQIPRGRARLESHALVLIPTDDQPAHANRLVSQKRRRLVEDDKIHTPSGRHFEIGREPIQLTRGRHETEDHPEIKVAGRTRLASCYRPKDIGELHISPTVQHPTNRFDGIHDVSIAWPGIAPWRQSPLPRSALLRALTQPVAPQRHIQVADAGSA
jgi:hypothetical protein